MESLQDQIIYTDKDQDYLKEIESKGYSNQNEMLIEMGFTDLRRNSKFLQRFIGNVDLTVSYLTSKCGDESSEEESVMIDEKEESEKRPKLRGAARFKERQAKLLEEVKQLHLENQIAALEAKGYTKLHKNVKALKKFNGEVDKVLAKFEEKEAKKKANKESKEQSSLDQIKKLGYEEANKKLFAQGFTSLHKNLKYLKKSNGDLDKATEELKGKQLEKKHEKKARVPNAPVVEYDDVPNYITRIYLDGNNMLFCEDAIRKACLRRKKKAGEISIGEIAWEYLSVTKRFHIVLVYDRTSLKVNNTFTAESDGKKLDFTVLSAAPKYQTSDDALVDWAQQLGGEAKSSLFVTSDRELQRRLIEAGVTDIMKPGRWLKMVKGVIGEEKYVSFLPSSNSEEKK